MQGRKLDDYIAYYERLTALAGYDPDNRLCLKYFTDGLPSKLYHEVLSLDRPQNYEDWKAAAIERQGIYEHCDNRNQQQRNRGKPHPAMYDPFSSLAPRTTPLRRDPDAMDTLADRGRIRQGITEEGDARRVGTEWEQRNEPNARPPFPPRDGYLQRQREQRNLKEVQCYNCQQYGHISRYCRRPRTNTPHTTEPSKGQRAQESAEDQANSWLRQIGGESDEVKELVLETVWRRKDFQDA